MLDENNRVSCFQLLDRHGFRHQLLILVEELAELEKEACKMLRAGFVTGACTEEFAEELADVVVMIEQAKIMFSITDEEINMRARNKLMRALARGEKNENL